MTKLKTVKDTDYLFASTRIKAIEKNLLTRDKLEQMNNAKSPEDALKMLAQFGWPQIRKATMSAVEEALIHRRNEALSLVREMTPGEKLVDIFSIKYDYHNLKILLKSEATGDNPDNLIIDEGIFPYPRLKAMIKEEKYLDMSSIMSKSIIEARDVLARTQDPQLLDLLLDKAMYADMLELAESLNFSFLKDYVILMIDSANLRTYVRSRHMGKGNELLTHALIPGGAVSAFRLLKELSDDVLERVFYSSPLASAAQVGARALRGKERMDAVDLACDNVLLQYLKKAKYVAFGAEPLIGYLAAVETEVTSVRTVITGQMFGIPAETISKRLRETYM